MIYSPWSSTLQTINSIVNANVITYNIITYGTTGRIAEWNSTTTRSHGIVRKLVLAITPRSINSRVSTLLIDKWWNRKMVSVSWQEMKRNTEIGKRWCNEPFNKVFNRWDNRRAGDSTRISPHLLPSLMFVIVPNRPLRLHHRQWTCYWSTKMRFEFGRKTKLWRKWDTLGGGVKQLASRRQPTQNHSVQKWNVEIVI